MTKEELNIEIDVLRNVQKNYQSDIRSMVNYIQSNQNILSEYKLLNDDVWESLTDSLKNKKINENIEMINKISSYYGKEKKSLLKDYLVYILSKNQYLITSDFLNFMENLLHNTNLETDYFVKYVVSRLASLFNEL